MALTGTPVENRLVGAVEPLPARLPGAAGQPRGLPRALRRAHRARRRTPARRAALARVVRPFLLRRTKAEVARELPPRIETVVPVALSAGERRLYEDARLAALARLRGRARAPAKALRGAGGAHPAAAAGLPPAAGGRGVAAAQSSKLEPLPGAGAGTLRAEGQPGARLQPVRHATWRWCARRWRSGAWRYLYLDGQTPAAEREARVDAFQRGEGGGLPHLV